MIAGRAADPAADPVVEGNARLTGYAAVLLLLLLAAEGLTVLGIRQLLVPHVLLGFLLVPPTLLKLGSVGHRFLRYYAGDARYRAAGPPELLMRLLGPAVVVLTVVLFASGIELWLFGYRYGAVWVGLHKGSFVLWFFAMTVHVLAYLRRSIELAAADSVRPLPGALNRRSLLVGSLVVGAVLAIAMAPYPTPFAIAPEAG